MGVKNSDLVDLIASTLPDLPEQYFEVTWDNQDYEFCRIYQTERMEVDGGTDIQRKVMFDEIERTTGLRPSGKAKRFPKFSEKSLFSTDGSQ